MSLRDALLPEFDQEMSNTRKTLDRAHRNDGGGKIVHRAQARRPVPDGFDVVARERARRRRLRRSARAERARAGREQDDGDEGPATGHGQRPFELTPPMIGRLRAGHDQEDRA